MRQAILFALLLLGTACAKVEMSAPELPGPEATAEAVMAADQAFSDMAQRDGVQAAFMAFMDSEDGKLFRPGRIVQGRRAIEDDFSAWPVDTSLIWSPIGAHGAASGDLGVTWGAFRIEQGGQVIGTGNYVTAWRKNADGQWKGVIDLGVSAPPPSVDSQVSSNQE